MILRTVLVDGEILNPLNIELILQQYFQEIEIIGALQNVADANFFIRNNAVDVLFLDVSMPIESGFDLLDYFLKRNFQTIFVTAHEEYAVKALRVGAIDYILKPILLSELKTAIESVKAVLKMDKNSQENTITLNYEGGKSIVAISGIQYLKGFDNLTMIYMTRTRKVMVSKTLKYFEEILQQDFFRFHKSFLVNMNFASKIFSHEALILEFKIGVYLPILMKKP